MRVFFPHDSKILCANVNSLKTPSSMRPRALYELFGK
nr:MAG TPA: hypothetical protein [Bacteriophage sp.]